MLDVVIHGCNGAMGQVLTKAIEDFDDINIVAGVDLYKDKIKNSYPVYKNFNEIKENVNVIIDFSHHSLVKDMVKYCAKTKTPVVIATTGISEDDINEIEEASKIIPIFKSANMSLGINVLINLVRKASNILNESFDIEIIEKHHNKKLDSPSGTAFMIANEINLELDNSKKYIYGREGRIEKRDKNEIGIHAIRGGSIPGEHTVIFAGSDEILEVKHSALSKKIFAVGAIKAAKFIHNRSNGLYSMESMLNG